MDVTYHETRRGDCPILDFIKNLPDEKHQKAIIIAVDFLEKFSLQQLLHTGDVEKIKGIKETIYELKAHYGKAIYRILFSIVNGNSYLLLIFDKKDQKIKKKYINKAIDILKNI
jgi:phage-related protein